MDDAVWTPTTFTKNRERLLAGDIARQFFAAVLAQARGRRLLSDEHFTVDGTLLEAWAAQKSFTRKDGTSPGRRTTTRQSAGSASCGIAAAIGSSGTSSSSRPPTTWSGPGTCRRSPRENHASRDRGSAAASAEPLTLLAGVVVALFMS